MTRRDADGAGVISQMLQADRALIIQQRTDQTEPAWQVADGSNFRIGHPHLDELLEVPIRRKHAECAIPRVDEFHRGFHDPPQHGGQLEMFRDGLVCSEKRLKAGL